MKISLKLLSKNWGPLLHLKNKLSGPYNKIIGGFRFLTIYNWRDYKIYHDLICFLIGKSSVVDLQTYGNEARFRRFHFLFPKSGTQLEEIVREVFVFRIYEGFGARISNGDVVLDCGANIGLFTLYAQNKIGSAGKIICIEPVRETYELLISNVLKNPFINSQQFVPLNLALSGKTETRIFVYSEERNGSATGCIERFGIAKGTRDSYKKLDISCTSMDEIVFNDLKIRIDFIKMDAEGMEKEIICGGKETIRFFKPKLVISPHFESKEIIKPLKEIRPDYKIVSSNNIIYAW
jgi:FkbM family methyltransferase